MLLVHKLHQTLGSSMFALFILEKIYFLDGFLPISALSNGPSVNVSRTMVYVRVQHVWEHLQYL